MIWVSDDSEVVEGKYHKEGLMRDVFRIGENHENATVGFR